MIYFLVLVLVGLMAMVLISLIRGLNAFRQTLDEDGTRDPAASATELQMFQNKMMWSRIKYQFAAIAVVALIAVVAR